MVRMSTLEITSKAGPSSLTDSGTVPRREMTCLGYRGVTVGIHGHHYSWWLFRVLCVWRGVLGPEPRVLCTLSKQLLSHSFSLRVTPYSIRLCLWVLLCLYSLIQGSRNRSGGSFLLPLKVASVHNKGRVQAGWAQNPSVGVGGLNPSGLFLGDSIPSA